MNRIMKQLLYLSIFASSPILSIPKTADKIFLTSAPKSGTHLIAKLIMLLTGREFDANPDNFLIIDPYQAKNFPRTKFFLTHAIASLSNISCISKGLFRGIFIIRDPRDQMVSFAHYIQKNGESWPELSRIPFDELLILLITDLSCIRNYGLWAMEEISKYHGIDTFIRDYLNWKNRRFIYTTYFEKLVGPHGGGSIQDQLTEIINIANHIKIRLSLSEAQEIADSLFGGSGTFHEGKIGSWKKYFNEEHKKAFKEIAGQCLIDLGYEKDFDW